MVWDGFYLIIEIKEKGFCDDCTPIQEPMPIRRDEHGVLRIGNTRVMIDGIIYSFLQGATPETIVSQYPSVSLADVYLVLGYYLNHRDEIDAYLRHQEAEAYRIRQEWEAKFPPKITKAELET